MQPEEYFRTTELSLACVLQMRGFTPVFERDGQNPVIVFCFNPKEAGRQEELGDLVARFERREMLVEPREYMVVQKRIREKLYDLLGVRKGRRVRGE